MSLFFFFFVMLLITTLRRIELHPVNYFFLAAAFFAFHLLLAYLVDHIDIHLAFAISSAVSLALVVSYLRLVVGMRFAAVEAGLTQFLYLVLFSYAFFFKGFTGLTVTIGAILTLFVAMQLTGRIRWSERLALAASARTSRERMSAPSYNVWIVTGLLARLQAAGRAPTDGRAGGVVPGPVSGRPAARCSSAARRRSSSRGRIGRTTISTSSARFRRRSSTRLQRVGFREEGRRWILESDGSSWTCPPRVSRRPRPRSAWTSTACTCSP